MKLVALFLTLCVAASVAYRRYDGYKVIRVAGGSSRAQAYLEKLELEEHFDFWTDRRRHSDADILVPPERLPSFLKGLEANGLTHEVMIDNIQPLVEAQAPYEGSKNIDWTDYYSYDDIQAWMDQIAANNAGVTIYSIGSSYEGRDMRVMNFNPGGATDVMWIDGGIHAREWISPATVTYMMNEIITNYANHPEIVDHFNWYFLPVHNPDGYEYARNSERLWRKSRTPQDLGCFGVDLNRNWDFHWGEAGTSDFPCSDIFTGEVPFSEVESQHVRDEVLRLNPKAFYTFHSYSQYWLFPWGWTNSNSPEEDILIANGQASIDALTAVHGTNYLLGCAGCLFSPAAGASDDWAHGVAGVRWVYTPELRDEGQWGFLLPADQIIPTGEETWAAMVASVQYFIDNPDA